MRLRDVLRYPWLREDDLRRVNKLLPDYQAARANECFISVPDLASFVSGTTIRANVRIFLAEDYDDGNLPDNVEICRIATQRCDRLASPWLRRTLDDMRSLIKKIDYEWRDLPITLFNLSVKVDNVDLPPSSFGYDRNDNGPTTIWISSEALQEIELLELEFESADVYYMLPGRKPFSRALFGLSFEACLGSPTTMVWFSYPTSLGLRGRVDGSEYMSLPHVRFNSVDEATYLIFFSSQRWHIRYYWGSNNTATLLEPIIPLTRAALSFLAFGLSLLASRADLPDLAATVYTLGLVPPILHFLTRPILWIDPHLEERTWVDHTSSLAFAMFIPAVALTAYQLVNNSTTIALGALSITLAIDLVAYVQIAIGITLLLTGAIVVGLINVGALQHFVCDECENWIAMRNRAALDENTRETLHRSCDHKRRMRTLRAGREEE